jgi:hypothetical protein
VVRGIATFVEYFKAYREDYIVIGGLATAMVMHDLGFTSRATKDIDLVVVSKKNEGFIKALLKFIGEGQYRTKERTANGNRHNLFRFFDSQNSDYPEQIELFAIHDEDSAIVKDTTIIPIETPEFYPYLSAILLNSDYFNLLIRHTDIIDGLHVATPTALIPLKIHAYLNLIEPRRSDAEKHLKDVVKLAAALSDGETVELQGEPKNDFEAFMSVLNALDEHRVEQVLESAGIQAVFKEDIIKILNSVYRY